MKNYTKPVVLMNDELAEGVYAASGDCYTVTTNIHQKPEVGRGDYRIQVNGEHKAKDSHHSANQVLTISFNLPVVYSESQGKCISGDGTNCLKIAYGYHNNASDNIGLGDVVVTADQGLEVESASLSCDHKCDYGHTW